jgi:4-hydroxy-tetrahydrodipicolinate synthase
MDYAKADAKQAARSTFEGLWAATTTPFDARGRMDLDALAGDLAHLVDDLEIDGVFCTGVMSEFWALSVAERHQQVEAVVAGIGGRCPVIAHTGHHSITETIELTRHAEAAGADFCVVVRPYYPQGSDEGIYAFYDQLCRAVDIGVWIFDTSYAGPPLPLDLVDRLADLESICGIKVGHPQEHYLDVLERVGDRILVCSPNESAWLANMRDHGQRVFMSSAAPYLYQTAGWRPMRDYTQAALAGDMAKATEIAATLEPVRAVADHWLHGRWNRERVNPLPMLKAWAGLAGMSGGPVRPPLSPPAAADVEAMAADLEAVGLV